MHIYAANANLNKINTGYRKWFLVAILRLIF